MKKMSGKRRLIASKAVTRLRVNWIFPFVSFISSLSFFFKVEDKKGKRPQTQLKWPLNPQEVTARTRLFREFPTTFIRVFCAGRIGYQKSVGDRQRINQQKSAYCFNKILLIIIPCYSDFKIKGRWSNQTLKLLVIGHFPRTNCKLESSSQMTKLYSSVNLKCTSLKENHNLKLRYFVEIINIEY